MNSIDHPPPLWEIEPRIIDVVCEQGGFARREVRPESRLIEDLHIDSLDLVELLLAIEETFAVTIPDDLARLPFISGSVTVADLARIVQHEWGTGEARRAGWSAPKRDVQPVARTPFTQLGGELSEREWHPGPLYDAMPRALSGCPQMRRRTDGMRCILIPGADVEIGSSAVDALPDQQPAHVVPLAPFLIDAEPVSTLAFSRFLNSIHAPPKTVHEWCGVGPDDRRGRHFQLEQKRGAWSPRAGTECQPMVLVSWFGANAYSRWAHRADWREFREAASGYLPTEAQWEYAARGARWQRFPWGDATCTPGLAHVALHTARADYPSRLPLADVTTRLGLSPFGVQHMAGNVWNWCRDWYAPDFYSSPEASRPDAVNELPTGIRAERGGSWIGPAELAASSYRRGRPPHARGRCLGFRCAGKTPASPQHG